MIYFLEAPELHRIKIGYANDVAKRMKSIKDGSPTAIALIGSVEGSRSQELSLHRLFRAHRLHGEWFADCPEVRGLVIAICDGSEKIQTILERRKPPAIAWDADKERADVAICAKRFMDRNGRKSFMAVSGVGQQMCRAIIKREASLSPARITRLINYDPAAFLPEMALLIAPSDLRRLRREIDALIGQIEREREAA